MNRGDVTIASWGKFDRLCRGIATNLRNSAKYLLISLLQIWLLCFNVGEIKTSPTLSIILEQLNEKIYIPQTSAIYSFAY